ncbi:MAG: AMP-binding protein [Syntrophomonadaceae bacterium]
MINRFNPNETLWERWSLNAALFPEKEAIIHWDAENEPYRWTFGSLLASADKFALALIHRGIRKGDVCAIIVRHNAEFYPLYLAIASIGAIPAVLAYPNGRLHPDKFRQGLEGMAMHSGLDWIMTERELEHIVAPLTVSQNSMIKGIIFPLEFHEDLKSNNEEYNEILNIRNNMKSTDPFLLQHSSGTTGLQKPVLLTHKETLLQIANYSEALKLTDADKVATWLPLYHDMGLIAAFHMPLASGITTIQMDPFQWVMVPEILLDAISKEKATLSWLPNFAFNLMSDKIRTEDLEGISLESVRMLINCSEPVRYDSFMKFLDCFGSLGVTKEKFGACYGMAEITFSATQTEPGVEPMHISVDRQMLSKGTVKPADGTTQVVRVCVSSGKPIRGTKIRILDENGSELPEGMIGEIVIKSETVFEGYRNYPEKTAEVLKDGWYYSGDYGFVWDGYIYAIGRKKDIIIVAGNNIYPEDVEDAVMQATGVIPGRVIAFGEEDASIGSEQISVIAESHFTEPEMLKKLRMDIIKSGMQIDVTIKNVYIVPPRWLIKSSAGKPARKANMERILKSKEEVLWG